MEGKTQIFVGTEDRYNGVTVDSTVEQCTAEIFSTKLKESMKAWHSASKRGIWFKIALEQSDWVPILAKNGFNFHHAKEGYVMMYNWIAPESNNVPTFAHTMLAVGAVVINDKSEVLVVKERHFLSSHWKLPGGLLEPGENIEDGAIREVQEETNISCTFKSVISFRHTHQAIFGCSDLYAVVALQPLSSDIRKCDREISECKWMNIDEYLSHSEVTKLNKFFIEKYLEHQKHKVNIQCVTGTHEILNRKYCVYSIGRE